MEAPTEGRRLVDWINSGHLYYWNIIYVIGGTYINYKVCIEMSFVKLNNKDCNGNI